MKNKPKGITNPAFGVKKDCKAEVSFCHSYPPGETVDNLILSEVKKKNNEQILQRLMDRTFAFRRQDVIQGSPLIADFKNRWLALFQENEVTQLNAFKWYFPISHQHQFLLSFSAW